MNEDFSDYNAADNSAKCYDVAIAALRDKLASFRSERIGDCTLWLGDCREIMPLLPKVDAIITDAPYERHMHDRRKGVKRLDGGPTLAAIDFDSVEEVRPGFLKAVSCSGWLVCFCTPEGIAIWRDAIEAAGLRYKRAIAWLKPDAPPQFNGQGPGYAWDALVTAWCGKGYSRWNGGGGRNYIEMPSRDGSEKVHPTQKPLKLMQKLVGLFSQPEQVVLDPFMGSGTTGVACVHLKRKFIGIECNEAYFEVACERIRRAQAEPSLFVTPMETTSLFTE